MANLGSKEQIYAARKHLEFFLIEIIPPILGIQYDAQTFNEIHRTPYMPFLTPIIRPIRYISGQIYEYIFCFSFFVLVFF